MDDTLLLYRNVKASEAVGGIITAYDVDSGQTYSIETAKIFVPNIISAATALSMGLQNGDKFIQGNSGSPTGIYQLVTLDNTVPAGVTSVTLTNKVAYCEADMCFYKFTSATVNSTTIYLYEIYQPYIQFNYHNTSEQIALKDFTYTAERMGKTPTLTADFYDKECYDNLWDTSNYRFSDIFTIFRGERYYFKLTPQSQMQNTDARYKHSINFVSEREKIEHAKMFDVVTTSTPDSPVSDSSKFVFYGTLSEFADRINASLIKEGVTFATTYNGTTVFSGYHVEIKIKDGNNGGIDSSMLTKAATVSIENNSILEALGHLDTDYGVSYYVDGYTIWIADFEADLTGTGHPAIQYGEENSLLQITRQNVTKNVVTRITGYGSEDNIPYYYPNPCESGFLQAIYDQRSGSSGVVKHPYEWAKISNILTKATPLLSITSEPIYPNKDDKYYNSSDKKIYQYNGTSWVDTGYAVYGTTYTYGGNIYMRRGENDTNYYRTLVDKTSDYDKFLKNTKADVFEYGRPYNVYPSIDPEIYIDPNTQQQYRIIIYEISMDSAVQLYARFSSNRFSVNNGSSLLESTSNTGSTQNELFSLHDISFNSNHVLVKIRQNVGYEFTNGYKYESKVLATYNNGNGDVQVAWPEEFYTESGLYCACDVKRSGIFGIDWLAEDYVIGEEISLGTAPYGAPDRQPWNFRFVYCDQLIDYVYNVQRWYAKWQHNGNGWDWGKGTKLPKETNKCYRDIPTGKIYRWNGSSYVYVATQASSSPASLSNLPHLIVYKKEWYRNTNTGIPQKLFAGDNISDYGLYITGTPIRGDKITFDTAYYMQPQQYLMPSIYYKSNGARRFFDAISYPYSKVRGKDVDYDIGEYMRHFINPMGYHVTNENYESDHDTGTCYAFENIIDKGHPRTHVEQISDIKPSIEGLTTTIGGQTVPADVFSDFCYDDLDCDDTWDAYERENGGEENINLKHPHFFAKLRPLGFNIFDMAIDESEMIVNFTSGCCMACSFKIKVGKESLQNIIALFDTDVYRENDNGVIELWHSQGTPMRYSDRPLYSDINGTTEITHFAPPQGGSDDDSIKYDGDVITSEVNLSRVQSEQLNTTNNSVWIALEKDTTTFSYPMPCVSNNMKPVATTDTFVFTHIKMPLRFVRAAEERLSKALVEYMSANNAELFHYSIKFSRIFLEDSGNTYASDLNENVKLHILYADHADKSFYVKSYTYKKVGNEPLPEISVELRENINVARYRYTNRIEFDRWGDEWVAIRAAEDIVKSINGTGNGNGSSIVNTSLVSMLSRHLVSRNGSVMRGVLNASNGSKIIGNLSIVRDNGLEMPVRDIDLNVGIDEESGLRGKTKNMLTDIGILNFDETKNYDVDEMCVYEGRLMRFTQKKTAGVWDATKATNDSVSNCIFRALGVQEYNASRTTAYNKGDKFYRNNKVYRVDTAFTPMVSGTPVTESVFTRCAKQLDIVEFFAEKNFTETLNSTVTELSRIANNLNEQILGGDSGLAVIVAAVNDKLANLTAAMVTENNTTRQYVSALAKALAENEVLQNDQGVVSTSQTLTDYLDQTSAVSTNADAAHTAITGANTESVYNKLLAYIADKMFGQKVSDVHTEGGSDDSAYAITLKLYETSQYMIGVPIEFSKDSAYQSGQMLIHLKHIYALNADKASGVDWDGIDPSDLENADAMLQKAVIFTTDTYDVSNGSTPFLAYGMYLMAAAFGEYVQKFVSDSGDNGVIYAKLAETIKENTKEYVDGSDRNMFTEHTAVSSVGTTYTVLQYTIMRLEMNGYLFAASMYDKELNKDDDHHIIFAIEPMKKMCDYFVEFMQQQGTKEVTIGGETVTCYYAENSTIADKFGYNYLYSADYLVYTGVMYYNSDNKEYYLPVG